MKCLLFEAKFCYICHEELTFVTRLGSHTLNTFGKFQYILCNGSEHMTKRNVLPIAGPEESISCNFLLASLTETLELIVLKFSESIESNIFNNLFQWKKIAQRLTI